MLSFFRIAILVKLLLIIENSPQTQTQHLNSEPKLAQLLANVENCDLQIIHNGRSPSNMAHTQLLPTMISNMSRFINDPIAYVFIVGRVRVSSCRIIYTFLHSKGSNPFTTVSVLSEYIKVVFGYLGFYAGPRFTPNNFLFMNYPNRNKKISLDNPVRN